MQMRMGSKEALTMVGDLHPRWSVSVLDTEMSDVDTDLGDPIMLLHS